jgi:hypothetical protein
VVFCISWRGYISIPFIACASTLLYWRSGPGSAESLLVFSLLSLAGRVGVLPGPLCKHDMYVKYSYISARKKNGLPTTPRLNTHTARRIQTKVERGSSAFRHPPRKIRRASMRGPDHVGAGPVGRGQSKGRKVCHGIWGRGPTKQPTNKPPEVVSGVITLGGKTTPIQAVRRSACCLLRHLCRHLYRHHHLRRRCRYLPRVQDTCLNPNVSTVSPSHCLNRLSASA